ncbi:ABC transporter permease, partial [Paenibacillus sp. MCAF20]
MIRLLLQMAPPIVVFIVAIGAWELIVSLAGTPSYLLPKPSDVFVAAKDNWGNLLSSVSTTVLESVLGFAISVVLGIVSAILLSLSKLIEKSFYPYAIILQTIPVVAIAPIIVIWLGAGVNAIVMIAFVISFFPILSNTLIGLN